jgi:inhibitor of cysteine peptidase
VTGDIVIGDGSVRTRGEHPHLIPPPFRGRREIAAPSCSLGGRRWLAGLFAIAAFAASLAPLRAQENETIHLAIGGATVIALPENPSTGYGWRLARPASRNLALVSVSNAGFARSTSGLIGAPGVRQFRIAARRPGTAVAVFDYIRPWEHVAPARRHVVTIDVAGR